MIQYPSTFNCEGKQIAVVVRNNQNGDYSLAQDLENLDKGSFVLLDSVERRLMLPLSFKAGEITFTDGKWLWSFKDNVKGLRVDQPRYAKYLPDGKIEEYCCQRNS
ncbi:hypothetical protein [Prochlorococcus sp. MIT 1223]|uniref:hypothetical protein n=1 Tax=Prochlorococcus sp. MIT 1223 TaxID=3096217 RepID=UPI002A754E1D|nr:hypothetical protein [Prochlorococcus sp. MIT 1223]